MTVSADASANVSLRLSHHAREAPDRPAIVTWEGRSISYGRLEERVQRIAAGLAAEGLRSGERVSLFVRPGIELVAVTHALFRLGAVPVLIDPGMGRRNLLACVERMAPVALIAIPRAHVARRLFPRAFRSVRLAVVVGPRRGRRSLARVEAAGAGPFVPHAGAPSDPAAILFTSGSTGPPKGVTATHGNFQAQLQALETLYDLRPGEVDVACFPLFALFDHALGITTVFPEVDPSRPATCDPERVLAAIEEHQATFSFASPAVWRRVLPAMRRRVRRFSTLRRITVAGAPIPPWLVQGLRDLLPEGGEVHTPYGATEALPVASLSGAELARLRPRVEAGEGTPVGRPAPGTEVRIVQLDDGVLGGFGSGPGQARVLGDGEPGEICVRSAAVTREYAEQPGPTALAKIEDADGALWHRMGDVGYRDPDGVLWFCGRKAHRLETERGVLFPVPVENVFNDLCGVHRSALVGVGEAGVERPVLLIELEAGARRDAVLAAVEERRRIHPAGGPITAVRVHPGFPVDVRHNAKIHRLALKAWAEARDA